MDGFWAGGDGGSNIRSSGKGLKKSFIRPFLLFLPGVCGSKGRAGTSCFTRKVPPVVVGSSRLSVVLSMMLMTLNVPAIGVVIEMERVPWEREEKVSS